MSTPSIAQLNDAFRKAGLVSGRFMLTSGVRSQRTEIIDQAISNVLRFDAFSEDNDPYGEHDFGAFTIEGVKFFWKIDYYDNDLTGGSPDPADSAQTKRVLTLLLAEEW